MMDDDGCINSSKRGTMGTGVIPPVVISEITVFALLCARYLFLGQTLDFFLCSATIILVNLLLNYTVIPSIPDKPEGIVGWYRDGLKPWVFSANWKREDLSTGAFVLTNFVSGMIIIDLTGSSRRIGCKLVCISNGTGSPLDFQKSAFECVKYVQKRLDRSPVNVLYQIDMRTTILHDYDSKYLTATIQKPWKKSPVYPVDAGY
jgi:hypothetical protein